MSSSAKFSGIKDFFGKPQVQVVKTETQSQHTEENKVEDPDNRDWLQSLKQFFTNVPYYILVASLTPMALS